MDKKIKQNEKSSFKGIWKFTIRDKKTGKIKRIYRYENIIPTIGRQQVMKALAGSLGVIEDIEINFTSLGTGTATPTNGDTKLETEVFRKGVASVTFNANKLFVTAFYTAPEVSGTFKEAGIHIKGTGAVDSGILYSKVAIDVNKTLSERLSIDYTVTLT